MRARKTFATRAWPGNLLAVPGLCSGSATLTPIPELLTETQMRHWFTITHATHPHAFSSAPRRFDYTTPLHGLFSLAVGDLITMAFTPPLRRLRFLVTLRGVRLRRLFGAGGLEFFNIHCRTRPLSLGKQETTRRIRLD